MDEGAAMKKKDEVLEVQKLEIEIQEKESIINEYKRKIVQINDDILWHFKLYHLIEERGYIRDDAILQYRLILDAVEKFITNQSARERFSFYEEQLRNQLKILEVGKKGEEAVFEAMELLGSRIKYLTNIRFKYKNIDVEVDLIVIAPTGIFSIEIKNWKHDAVLNDKGILESRTDKNKKTNIIEQIRRHENCIYRILVEDETGVNLCNKDLKVYSIILWQNLDSNLTDNFKRLPVCCVNDLEYEIADRSKYTYDFSDIQIEEIYNFLCCKKEGERKYELRIADDFVDKFIECATLEQNIELEKVENELNLLYNRKERLEEIAYRKKYQPVKYYGGKTVEMTGKAVKKVGKVSLKVAKVGLYTAVIITELLDS